MSIVAIPLLKEDYQKCLDFSNKWIQTSESHINNRGQGNKGKMISDHAIGKLAELGIYNFFDVLKLPCSRPDFDIYSRKHKNFGADIIVGNNNIHIKSCRTNTYNSWIFQYGGKGTGHTDPLLNSNDVNNYLALCFVDTSAFLVKIVGIINANFCKNNSLYKLPKINSLINTKRALYYDDIKNFDKEILWSFVIQAEKAGLLNKS